MREARGVQMKPMVVAVDGSLESESALRWAVEQAEAMGCPLRIITCYQHYYAGGEVAGVSWDHFESTKRSAELQAQEVIERVMGTTDVDHVVALGPVDSAMIEHSKSASMLVLGTRSSYGLKGKLRSSATDRITGKVTCPVVSIPLEAPVLQGCGL